MKTSLFITFSVLVGLLYPTQNKSQDTVKYDTVALKAERLKDSIAVIHDSIEVNKKRLDAKLTDSAETDNNRLEKVIDNGEKRGKKLDKLIIRVREKRPK